MIFLLFSCIFAPCCHDSHLPERVIVMNLSHELYSTQDDVSCAE